MASNKIKNIFAELELRCKGAGSLPPATNDAGSSARQKIRHYFLTLRPIFAKSGV
jgi:hypothetical protein